MRTGRDANIDDCQLLTAQELSNMLKLHPRSCRRLGRQAEAGLVDFPKPLRITPKTVRWRLSDVQAYIARLTGGRTESCRN